VAFLSSKKCTTKITHPTTEWLNMFSHGCNPWLKSKPHTHNPASVE
jgi:hypothetical protein